MITYAQNFQVFHMKMSFLKFSIPEIKIYLGIFGISFEGTFGIYVNPLY